MSAVRDLPTADRSRYGVTVVFWLDAADEGEAHSLVDGFVQSFPSQIEEGREGDVLIQDTEDAGEAIGEGE